MSKYESVYVCIKCGLIVDKLYIATYFCQRCGRIGSSSVVSAINKKTKDGEELVFRRSST